MADNTGTLPNVDAVLDTTGLYCPEPIMLMHNKVRDMAPGQVLKVIATDPATTRDVPKFCQFLGHELLEQHTASESNYLYFIRLA
ncbi:sulfurtransferase TusA [Halomonas sp. QX-2]|jgi:tRNA 2-thiouridine synthesizing protein A|uniref:Sulfurtransferase TusA n=1 Tax=Vreelandella sedimenti TaxID=2729618 RepID=A0A7Z0NAQ5_9GAMM|nr:MULTISPECIES: sulfurtransferase TusA [Halomonas]NYT74710.1 sulfurtransferase TusA [Halomonas sedimenti]|tara:strand:+ start:1557 stop:1811 length:255 start_codon:yes stop_codon:yes gene_type:complete